VAENPYKDTSRLKTEAAALTGEEIGVLVQALASSDDAVRYPAFLLLSERALQTDDVYPYFEIFQNKLKSENAFQRGIGLSMCARNARWDEAGKWDHMIDEYLACIRDEKPMVVRLCIQNLVWILPCKKKFSKKIAEALMAFPVGSLKETQRKLVLTDILRILKEIRDEKDDFKMDTYFDAARESGLLDAKALKEFF
jgi:hypothetical protein